MHPNPAFRQTPDAVNLDYARDRGFGTLCVSGAEGPLLSHVPFLLNEAGDLAELHLVRSNPIARLATPGPAVLAIAGPDSYVSPDWYGIDDQVPTWNYVAVHLRGVLEPADPATLRDHLDRLSARFEADLLPKAPWTTDKTDPEALVRMMRMILPFRLRIEAVDGTWKLNQNKPEPARKAAADHIRAADMGQETRALALLMMGAGAPESDA